VELVIAISGSGRDVPPERATALIFGYAVGVDLTRRDTQVAARKAGRPWEHGKSFDQSAPMGSIVPAAGHPPTGTIWLEVSGKRRQEADLGQMAWSVPEIVSILSSGWELRPGDLIFTGTPAGVGALRRGDVVKAGIEGVGEIEFAIR
jgi:fumarylpyruvate hydrolase